MASITSKLLKACVTPAALTALMALMAFGVVFVMAFATIAAIIAYSSAGN